eukprot:196961-Amphidinium_carterae.1
MDALQLRRARHLSAGGLRALVHDPPALEDGRTAKKAREEFPPTAGTDTTAAASAPAPTQVVDDSATFALHIDLTSRLR